MVISVLSRNILRRSSVFYGYLINISGKRRLEIEITIIYEDDIL